MANTKCCVICKDIVFLCNGRYYNPCELDLVDDEYLFCCDDCHSEREGDNETSD